MAERVTEGVLLKVDKTTIPGTVYVELTEITSIDGPNESRSALDRTVLKSTARRYRPGLYDGGEVTLEFNFDPDNADHAWLHDQIKVKAQRAFRIFIPAEDPGDDDYNIDFNGFVTDWGTSSGGPDEFITGSVTIKVDGDVAYAADASE